MKLRKAFVPGICAAIALTMTSAHANESQAEEVSQASASLGVADNRNKHRTSRGFGFIRSGQPDKAIAEFDAVIAASERQYIDDSRPRFCARDERDVARIADAADTGGKDTVLIDPAICDAYFGKGFALIDMGRGDLAEAELRRATELAPFDAHYANEYAELFKSRRQWDSSLALFTRAWEVVDKNPAGPDARIAARSLRGIGYSEMMLGDLNEAERRFRQSLEFEPGNKAAGVELGFIARKKAIGS